MAVVVVAMSAGVCHSSCSSSSSTTFLRTSSSSIISKPYTVQSNNSSKKPHRHQSSFYFFNFNSTHYCRKPIPIPTTTASSSSGSTGTESSSMTTEDLLDRGVQVFDLDGKGKAISDLWQERKAVVAFARHFGCVLCRKRAGYLAAKKDVMDAAGVALVLIGPGNVDQAIAFSKQTKFPGEVYADPDYSSYEALRFVSGVGTTFTPGSGLKIIQAYMEGYRQDWGLSFEKDTRTRGGWQQGGIIVAGPGKSNISYIYKDKEAGDDPDIQEVLQACCS